MKEFGPKIIEFMAIRTLVRVKKCLKVILQNSYNETSSLKKQRSEKFRDENVSKSLL